jgi:hypothetical protein
MSTIAGQKMTTDHLRTNFAAEIAAAKLDPRNWLASKDGQVMTGARFHGQWTERVTWDVTQPTERRWEINLTDRQTGTTATEFDECYGVAHDRAKAIVGMP